MNAKRLRYGFCTNSLGLLIHSICLGLFLVAYPLHATTVVPPSFDELVNHADYVVRAVVKSVVSELRNDGSHRLIITQVELDVREVISGTAPSPLILTMLGGKVDDEEMFVDGTPKFQVGDEDILFIRGNGAQFCPLVALLHGRYPIKHDSVTGLPYMTRGDGTPLADEQQVGRPLATAEKSLSTPDARPIASALTPDQFVSRIKSTRVKKSDASQSLP